MEWVTNDGGDKMADSAKNCCPYSDIKSFITTKLN